MFKLKKYYCNKQIFILFIINIIFADRGDLISADILATRNVSNTQAYIDNELSQIVSDMFSIDPAQYGYWL